MLRQLFNCTILLFFLTTINISAQVERFTVRSRTNASLYQERLKSHFRNDSLATRDSIKQTITALAHQRGYLSPTIQVDSTNADTLTYFTIDINEGLLHTFSEPVLVSTDSLLLVTLQRFPQELTGSTYNPEAVEAIAEQMILAAEKIGYPFAIITVLQLTIDTTTAEVIITFEAEGKGKRYIDEVVIEGNTKTKDHVILRELQIESGMLYNPKVIEEIPARLNRLGFFQSVQSPTFLITSKGKGILSIKVEEKETNNFDGVIGYVPGTDKESGYLTGLVNIQLKNLFGTGRYAGIRWQQLSRNSQEVEIRYLEPYIFSFPFDVAGGFFQRKQDSLFVRRHYEGSILYRLSGSLSVSLSAKSESVIPTLYEVPVFTVFNSTALTTGFTVRLDTRDDPIGTRAGLLFSSSFLFTNKSINGPAEFVTASTPRSVTQRTLSTQLAGFWEFYNNNVFASELNAKDLSGDLIEFSDLFTLGGNRSLRGYLEEQFRGEQMVWMRNEYRFMLGLRNYLFLFYDYGYIKREAALASGEPGSVLNRSGYGGGITLETGLGLLGVSYALGEGDSFSSGKIHFGIISSF